MENEPNGNVFWVLGKQIKESAKKTETNMYKCKVHCYLGHTTPKNGKCT